MAEDEEHQTIDINYVKSPSFRETHSEGIIGGATPHGQLWLGFYNERFPVPRIVRHRIKVDPNTQNAQIDQDAPSAILEGRSGLMRNLEFGVTLSVETAETLHTWLGAQIAAMRGEKA